MQGVGSFRELETPSLSQKQAAGRAGALRFPQRKMAWLGAGALKRFISATRLEKDSKVY